MAARVKPIPGHSQRQATGTRQFSPKQDSKSHAFSSFIPANLDDIILNDNDSHL
jgi:hypothetical protein